MRVLAIPLLVLLGIGAVVLFNTFYIVNPTQQAIVLQLGEAVDAELEPGLKVKAPFIQNVVFVEKRVLELDMPTREVLAEDQRRFLINAFIRYRVTDALRFYQAVGTETGLRGRMAPIFDSRLREVLGARTFDALLSAERASLMLEIRDSVNSRAQAFGVEVVDVRILRVDLPQENSQAIFDRMRTERERQAAEIRAEGREQSVRIRSQADREKTVLLAEANRDSEIIRGEGDAERNRIFGEAFGQDPEFFAFYRSMQAYRDSLADEGTTLVLSPDTEFFEFFQSDGTR